MKKFLLTIFTLVYLVSATGVAMDVHFCMGKRAGADFFSSAGKACGLCGMAEKKGCCNDDHRFYKLDNAHKNVVPGGLDWSQNFTALQPLHAKFIALQFNATASPPFNPTKPPPGNIPLFILNSVFRI